ncbi:MAG: hypothetical protein DRP01_01720 [Archaeoglobales archaeon]|nr:MAG: hypothetical protein DRP01_01720 [Archaeoglobales archaeon]
MSEESLKEKVRELVEYILAFRHSDGEKVFSEENERFILSQRILSCWVFIETDKGVLLSVIGEANAGRIIKTAYEFGRREGMIIPLIKILEIDLSEDILPFFS